MGTITVLGYVLSFFWATVSVPELAKWACQVLEAGEGVRSLLIAAGWLLIALALAAVCMSLADRPRLAARILLFALLPIWGLVLNHGMTERCKLECPDGPYRALASPEVYELVLLHALSVTGYAISRRCALDLPKRAEPWVVSLLLCGLVLHALLAIQLFDLLPGLILLPLTLPLLAPFATMVAFWRELARRSASLAGGIVRTPLVLVGYGLAQAFWRGRSDAAFDVFTRTCTHAFSMLPLEVAQEHCGHYLCTVAAHGHPSLVRPERWGVRRGRAIIVNRQLAIANAFEDLLHARWPRLGRVARSAYDRLAIPICRFITNRWLADALYVAMKPAEWLFYLALLLLDRESPERRIARMYR